MENRSADAASAFSLALDVDAPKVSEQVSLQASEWMARLQDEDADDALRLRFQVWHDAQPEHAAAWACLSRFTHYLQDINAHTPLLTKTLLAQSAKDDALARRRAGRRRVLKTLGVGALVLGGSSLALRETDGWARLLADHVTDIGEQRTVTLADGTQVVMNTRTVIELAYSPTQRLLRLVRGEVLVSTASAQPADSRPFRVHTRDGLFQALGTRFTVRQEAARTRVGVIDGAVLATPHDNPSAALVISAGEVSHVTLGRADPPLRLPQGEGAWEQGVLIVHDMPLATFLDELGRYRRGWLLCDEQAANFKVSGIYPVTDVDRVLRSLAQNLPVNIQRRTPYWVKIRANS